jgi:hypothetical protein
MGRTCNGQNGIASGQRLAYAGTGRLRGANAQSLTLAPLDYGGQVGF